ncbi:hypothetical protein [Maribacter cobaltidurans]|uniref:Uncharacterized protein n=1 Tax=Maribacter cobaltidurans TaxID=1178778 RepID=A0A223V8N4_9FLAO|nr:hypothetical protein [Maribacter cobaltidurans]ASV31666.1 hypothetical protein CJ263_16390 [Maribacter cobaltidurans]GGD93976.1 hypothetical protein GCM10011412_35000 [Maribacter cobaltidurans]
MTKKHRFYIVNGIIYSVFGLLGLLIRNDLIEYFRFNPLIVSTISVVLVLTGLVSVLFVYLQGGFTKDSQVMQRSNLDYRRQLERLRNEFYHIIKDRENIQIDEEKIKDIIDSKIDQITSETLFEQIKEKYESRLIDDIKHKALEEELYDVKRRIEREVLRTSRNSNINLSIGFFTTFIAIFFLGYSLLGVESNQESSTSFIYHFIPRLSLSLFIELFSFFFLRIYKKNLDDIKYLNNERTNIDLKLVALRTSIAYEESAALKEVILDLSKTERNFVLKKGESTVEIEKVRQDDNNSEKLLSSILKILDKK